eukprot:m.161792 g.161792  ORF g.161792 m.161792 type:complete len:60 (-) comp14367_c3_seq1:128-307(-)
MEHIEQDHKVILQQGGRSFQALKQTTTIIQPQQQQQQQNVNEKKTKDCDRTFFKSKTKR